MSIVFLLLGIGSLGIAMKSFFMDRYDRATFYLVLAIWMFSFAQG